MSLRSIFDDFVTVRADVQVFGGSIWVKPYDPTPMIVFNPSHNDTAIGEIIKAPNMERFLDYINFTANLYPYSQRMSITANDVNGSEHPPITFFFSQHEYPDISSGYAKVEEGEFSTDIYEALWSDLTADRVWEK